MTVLMQPTKMATPKQMAFMHKLLEERDGKMPTAEEQFVIDTIKGTLADAGYGVRSAGLTIDWLLAHKPVRTNAPARANNAAPAIPQGTYTVVLDEETYVTIRIAAEKWADGKVVASYLAGSDNEHSYKGFGFVNDKGINVWKRFAGNEKFEAAVNVLMNSFDEAHEKFLELAEAYAMKSGHCARCHRKLTVPASLHRGLGPECANKEGV